VRDDFSKDVVDTLAKRVGGRCCNPGCRKLTVGPRSDPAKIVCIGVAAHITAASAGGPRFDASLTPEQRRQPDNGIWLCQNCAKLVDNDAAVFPVALLRTWKSKAEAEARAEVQGGAYVSPPEDAAELELTVGGRAIVRSSQGADGKPPRASRYGYDDSGCSRHDYKLVVSVHNLGNERLARYHVDVEFPARALPKQPRATKSTSRAATSCGS
jgi:hypothetical protein